MLSKAGNCGKKIYKIQIFVSVKDEKIGHKLYPV